MGIALGNRHMEEYFAHLRARVLAPAVDGGAAPVSFDVGVDGEAAE
jgi:hypothetical protein